MVKFDKAEFVELLLGMDSSHESIVNSSSKFLNLNPDNFEAASETFFEGFKNSIEQSILKNKVVSGHLVDSELPVPRKRYSAEGEEHRELQSPQRIPDPNTRYGKPRVSDQLGSTVVQGNP